MICILSPIFLLPPQEIELNLSSNKHLLTNANVLGFDKPKTCSIRGSEQGNEQGNVVLVVGWPRTHTEQRAVDNLHVTAQT